MLWTDGTAGGISSMHMACEDDAVVFDGCVASEVVCTGSDGPSSITPYGRCSLVLAVRLSLALVVSILIRLDRRGGILIS